MVRTDIVEPGTHTKQSKSSNILLVIIPRKIVFVWSILFPRCPSICLFITSVHVFGFGPLWGVSNKQFFVFACSYFHIMYSSDNSAAQTARGL